MTDSSDWDQIQKQSQQYIEHLNSLSVEEYLERLRATGWLDHFAAEDAIRLLDKVAEEFRDDRPYAFYALAQTVFDPECIEGTGPEEECSYYAVIRQLAEASDGLFQPQSISDQLDEDTGTAEISFDHSGKRYARTVSYEDDWFQFECIDLINKALGDQGVERRFIALPAHDQCAHLVLIPPQTFEKAVQLKVIPDIEFYLPD